MAINNDISNFIIPAQYAGLYDLVYTSVDGGPTGCNININGVNVQMGSGSTSLNYLVGNGTDVPKYIKTMAIFPIPLTDEEAISLTNI
jgi:hypothetical protein